MYLTPAKSGNLTRARPPLPMSKASSSKRWPPTANSPNGRAVAPSVHAPCLLEGSAAEQDAAATFGGW
jgi:hypothetical protein